MPKAVVKLRSEDVVEYDQMRIRSIKIDLKEDEVIVAYDLFYRGGNVDLGVRVYRLDDLPWLTVGTLVEPLKTRIKKEIEPDE